MSGFLSAGIVGGPDIPDSANLHARYDATELSFSDGEEVTSWPDATDNGFDLSGSGPTFAASGINGNPSVSFDGTDDRMETVSWTTISQPFTVYVVHSRAGSGAGYEPIFDQKNNGQNDRAIMPTNESGSWGIWAGTFVTGGSSDTAIHIQDALYDGASSTVELDGSEIASGDPGSNSIGPLSIGSDAIAGSGDQFFGDIAEMLFYSVGHGVSTRSDVQSHLAGKWGISL